MQRSLVIDGRPTKPLSTETYVASSAGESTDAWLLPHAPEVPRAGEVVGRDRRAPQPHVSGTWSCTPAYDS